MGKLAQHSAPRFSVREKQRVHRLQAERRKLGARLQKINADLEKLAAPLHREAAPTPRQLERWFAELCDALPDLPPLAADFSRDDIYDEHD